MKETYPDSTRDPDITNILPEEFLISPIEPFVAAFGDPDRLPIGAIVLCALRYSDAGPLLRATLERAATGNLRNDWDDLVFFRGLHLVGARRDPLGFEPLMRFLRRPAGEVGRLLGDSIVESLPQIVAGVYDGNADALFDGIADPKLDFLVRHALFGAAAFITWEGRIDRARMVAFLERFDRCQLAPDGDVVWDAWARTIALLGLRDMAPAVEAAKARGAFDDTFWEKGEFEAILAEAERSPDDIGRFKESFLGYIEDVVVSLEQYGLDSDAGEEWEDEDREDEESMFPGQPPSDWLPTQPTINPWRHVGRNDPCPCGSGKKAKRCCLAA